MEFVGKVREEVVVRERYRRSSHAGYCGLLCVLSRRARRLCISMARKAVIKMLRRIDDSNIDVGWISMLMCATRPMTKGT
jgi:hypothetical protein